MLISLVLILSSFQKDCYKRKNNKVLLRNIDHTLFKTLAKKAKIFFLLLTRNPTFFCIFWILMLSGMCYYSNCSFFKLKIVLIDFLNMFNKFYHICIYNYLITDRCPWLGVISWQHVVNYRIKHLWYKIK